MPSPLVIVVGDLGTLDVVRRQRRMASASSNRLESRCEFSPVVVSEVRVGGPGRDDQVVATERPHVGDNKVESNLRVKNSAR